MIRHRPDGSGHPYSVDTEQRTPVDPIAGQPVILGVRTSSDVTAVSCELSIEGGEPRTLALAPLSAGQQPGDNPDYLKEGRFRVEINRRMPVGQMLNDVRNVERRVIGLRCGA